MKAPFLSGVLISVALAGRAATLYSVSGDPANSFVPDQFSKINTSPPAISSPFTLFDGSLGFNGGLTAAPGGVFYAIANDSGENGFWWRIQPNGSAVQVGALGVQGFLGGLAYNPSTGVFYGADLDSLGNTTLYSITLGGVATPLGKSLGTGFSGLAFDSANGLFYGIANDSSGASTLVDFTLAGSVNTVGSLGFGFGGLTYDPINNVFWAISPVNNSSSQLFQITASGGESAPIMTLGDGFVELAAAVPEPSTAGLAAAGLAALAWILNRRKKS